MQVFTSGLADEHVLNGWNTWVLGRLVLDLKAAYPTLDSLVVEHYDPDMVEKGTHQVVADVSVTSTFIRGSLPLATYENRGAVVFDGAHLYRLTKENRHYVFEYHEEPRQHYVDKQACVLRLPYDFYDKTEEEMDGVPPLVTLVGEALVSVNEAAVDNSFFKRSEGVLRIPYTAQYLKSKEERTIVYKEKTELKLPLFIFNFGGERLVDLRLLWFLLFVVYDSHTGDDTNLFGSKSEFSGSQVEWLKELGYDHVLEMKRAWFAMSALPNSYEPEDKETWSWLDKLRSYVQWSDFRGVQALYYDQKAGYKERYIVLKTLPTA